MLRRFLLSVIVAIFLVLVGCTEEEMSKKEERSEEIRRTVMKVTDPVCEMRIVKEHALKVEHKGKTYYFCSKYCRQNFQKEPNKYLKKIKIVDPVCGMEIEHMGAITSEYRGKTYHFCSAHCKDKFEKEPGRVLKK